MIAGCVVMRIQVKSTTVTARACALWRQDLHSRMLRCIQHKFNAQPFWEGSPVFNLSVITRRYALNREGFDRRAQVYLDPELGGKGNKNSLGSSRPRALLRRRAPLWVAH